MPRHSGKTPALKHIALAFPIGDAHLHAVTRGITDYAAQYARWVFTTSGEAATLPIHSLKGWRGSGIISILTSDEDAQAAKCFQTAGTPVVTFSGALSHPGVPRVRVDNAAIGKLAASHLLSRGYSRFAFYGIRDVAYSEQRAATFITALRVAGVSCETLLSPNTFSVQHSWQDEVESLVAWVTKLPRPIAILAVNDHRAQLLSNACELANLRIPHDVGILGIDNNPFVCSFSNPPLSSVECDWYAVGFQSAKLLDRLMRRQVSGLPEILIPPLGIAPRASTDITVVADPRLAKTLDYIRNNLREHFGVERLIHIAGTSRRTLEALFAKELSISPYDYLCRQRVDRAKEFLANPKRMTFSEIATRCGFPEIRALRVVFTRLENQTPAQFRSALKISANAR